MVYTVSRQPGISSSGEPHQGARRLSAGNCRPAFSLVSRWISAGHDDRVARLEKGYFLASRALPLRVVDRLRRSAVRSANSCGCARTIKFDTTG